MESGHTKPSFRVAHEFVEFIPDTLEERTLYISMKFATVTHRCFCGCGAEVVTPLSPARWQLAFDGETISLHPSIGSWSLPCQSHYWIRDSEVQWAPRWSKSQIKYGRDGDRAELAQYFGANAHAPSQLPPDGGSRLEKFWRRIRGD